METTLCRCGAYWWARIDPDGNGCNRIIRGSRARAIAGNRNPGACRRAPKQPSLIIQAERDGNSIIHSYRELVEHCNGYEEARWADWKNGDKTGLTVERFAKELRQHFKLRSSRIWHQDKEFMVWLKPFQKLLIRIYLPTMTNLNRRVEDRQQRVKIPPHQSRRIAQKRKIPYSPQKAAQTARTLT